MEDVVAKLKHIFTVFFKLEPQAAAAFNYAGELLFNYNLTRHENDQFPYQKI
jgi:hypothetical protein